ncbi:hypothetical protein MTR67_044460 [Solanum verrucosum]|uniref:Uncharacterized protein n=1 Tax=Solanum verrucosum TaxID=315347 RepID=A0AAF0US87_SOLVR|nr:hypothetical protein MTR67_044460 [Solanum verrucosum]
MHILVEWKGDEVGVRMFSGLEKLRITKCPLLKSTPIQFEILRELSIEGVDSEIPLFNLCNNLTSLVKLIVYDVKELTCLPDEMLCNNVSLQHLLLSLCIEFRELPQSLYNLHSLKILQISFCPNFSSFPVPNGESYLTSCQCLRLLSCDGLISFPSGMLEHCQSLQVLKLLSLRTLELWGHLHCDSLPYHLMQLSDRTEIEIDGFRIEALPHRFGNLTPLERLTLVRCKQLQHLNFSDASPKLRYKEICDCPLLEALSDGLGNLVSLEQLRLWNCEKLENVPSRDAM